MAPPSRDEGGASDRDPKTAFVLAGGGTKGAFEAGAIRYLVEERSVVPDVITAASAGAILGAVLAQARNLEELMRRTQELRDDLFAMTHTELLFGVQPWVEALDGTPLRAVIDSYVRDRTRPPIPGDSLPAEALITSTPGRRRLSLAARMIRGLPSFVRAQRQLSRGAGSLMTLDPLHRALRGDVRSGIRPIDPALVARPGLELRLAVTALNAGVLRYVTETGTIVEADAVTPVTGSGGGPVDLLEGVLASSSVPLIFPPRPMANDVYVDGGVLQNIPVEAAVRLGARRIIAILAIPLEQPPDLRDFTSEHMLGVFLRSMGAIAFADRQKASLAFHLPQDTSMTVIDPVADVVGPFEVAPGLMHIDMDYGWCRAADVMADLDQASRRAAADTTEAVVNSRTRAWHLEEHLWSARSAGPGDVRAIADCKRVVRDALRAREKLGLPSPLGSERWSSSYELHGSSVPSELPPSPFDEPIGDPA